MPTITTDIPLELYRAFGKEASYKINQYPINKHSKNIMEMDSIHNTNRNLTQLELNLTIQNFCEEKLQNIVRHKTFE